METSPVYIINISLLLIFNSIVEYNTSINIKDETHRQQQLWSDTRHAKFTGRNIYTVTKNSARKQCNNIEKAKGDLKKFKTTSKADLGLISADL